MSVFVRVLIYGAQTLKSTIPSPVQSADRRIGRYIKMSVAVRYLEFERGPSETVTLQWATYYDAADQAGRFCRR